ncbi:MAG: Shedu anti-phage system protein SduA domain-containing protein [Planctomycetota bacterium]
MTTRSPDLLADLKAKLRCARDQVKRYGIYHDATVAGVEALRRTLEVSDDEASLQRLLEVHPVLLLNQLAGGPAMVPLERGALFKQVEILDRHVADFAFVTVDSIGEAWYFIEIESAKNAFKSNGDHSARLRKGIQQVVDWQQTILQDRTTVANRLRELRSAHTGRPSAEWNRNPCFVLIIGRSTLETPANKLTRASIENSMPNFTIASWDRLVSAQAKHNREVLNHSEFKSLGEEINHNCE